MGRQSKGLLITLIVLAVSSVSLAGAGTVGEYSIRGLVRAAVHPKQLPRVRLLSGTSRLIQEIWADTAGHFSFSDLRSGKYCVEVSAPGFRTARQEVAVYSSTPELVVELESEAAGHPLPPGAILDARIPPRAWQEWEKAQQALQEANADTARKHLEKAVQEYERFAAAHRLLAQLDLDDNKLEDAEQHVREARIIEPDNIDGQVLNGALFNRLGHAEDALKMLDHAASVTPTWRGQFELAKAQFSLRDFAQAMTAAEKALELRGAPLPEAHILMGNILVNLRRYPDAARQYQTFLKLAPESPSAAPAREVLNKMKAAGIRVD